MSVLVLYTWVLSRLCFVMYIQTLLYTLEITSPVVLMVVLGIVLRKRNAIDEHFISMASKLVFNITMPLLIFMAIATADLSGGDHNPLILFSILAAVGSFLVGLIASKLLNIPLFSHGAFVQGAFRSNLAIIGLALCIIAYPVEGAILGAIVLAVVTPFYNIFAVWVLSSNQGQVSWGKQFLSLLKNPLIISILLALLVKLLGIELGSIIQKTGTTVGSMTLPLALICIGGSLNFRDARQSGRMTLIATLLKTVVNPGLIILAAILVGFRGEELLVMAIMFASPTAAASFVMASAMNADTRLTANVIALTTLTSAVTIATIIYVLTISGLV